MRPLETLPSLSRSLTSRDRHQALGSELDFLRSIACEGLSYLLAAATVYFLVVTALVARIAPPEALPLLLAQKVLYAGLLLAILFRVRAGPVPGRYFNGLLTLIIALCLSSALVTAMMGVASPLNTYIFILLLACALMDISYGWAFFHWISIWVSWFVITTFVPDAGQVEHVSELMGVQLLALAAMALRLRLYKVQYRILKELAQALDESEQVRASLDVEVEKRTEELKAANEDLHTSIQERELSAKEQEKLRDQLLQSQKMESLGRLAGGVAHDFNNLLTVITGNLELARADGPLEPNLDELILESSSAARKAAGLTAQLLAFSRKQVIAVRPFKIQLVVENSLKLVERLLGEDVVLKVQMDCPKLVVEGDASQIEQVVINLVVNARDAMPKGGTLEIGLRQVGAEVELRVSDDGEGIDPELHQRIFEPFFTDKPLAKGTGLGLSTVHGIVSKHGGRVELTSAPGEGASFAVFLPLSLSEGADADANPPLVPLEGHGKIMLVEDDHQVRKLAVRALRMSGYDVVPFEHAEAALASLDSDFQYDILVTDVVMPGMDGGKLAETVRSQRPDLPVLFMSGYTDDRLSSYGILRRDDCGFLGKPFTPIELRQAVANVLGRSTRSEA